MNVSIYMYECIIYKCIIYIYYILNTIKIIIDYINSYFIY